ncbi:uncharacterized protein MONOS_7351 [Monocercomonoides exilis]|uniref:uncharacterized protein n=1 Tax=Monocercomonoides exilis TaxID=2049356 RepID=UPI003559EAE4|nr:hypothetical protein MONOS_7351 [Monocercomonoides exilis]|eukprot:MONOS_7351.1-p1 / transcript=MONOS_7351.1 / gene=MONOS_7351 / organism=Monocercomonoides_exilis_PA203 / gene_product=unspecified product / transcript_product=unspecified product / location=Mono_scaffold00249:32875-33558(+) / protein_length=228 / sequence_SO=supercontig / SO=protein_coding / is_pseudo=false
MDKKPNPPFLVFSEPFKKPPISSSPLASYNRATQHLQPPHSSSDPIAPSSLSLSLSASLPHPLSSSSPNILASSLDSVHSDASFFYPSLAGIAGLIGLSGEARQTQGALTDSSYTATIADSLADNVQTDAVPEKFEKVNKELAKEGEKEKERERSRELTSENCYYLSANISLNRSCLCTVNDIPLSFSPPPGISTGIDVDVGLFQKAQAQPPLQMHLLLELQLGMEL